MHQREFSSFNGIIGANQIEKIPKIKPGFVYELFDEFI